MHAEDMLKYGHETLMHSLDAVDSKKLEIEGACGRWSVKNILAHLTSFEWVLVDVLRKIKGDTIATPMLDAMIAQGDSFNDIQVSERANKSYHHQLTEYLAAHVKATALLAEIPIETRRQKGLISWYGAEYDLEDFIIYTNYAHKREHSGQIDVFRDRATVRDTTQMISLDPYWIVS